MEIDRHQKTFISVCIQLIVYKIVNDDFHVAFDGIDNSDASDFRRAERVRGELDRVVRAPDPAVPFRTLPTKQRA